MKKIIVFGLMVALSLSICPARASIQEIPLPNSAVGSFIQMQNLPPMQRMSDEDVDTYIAPLQVMNKVNLLGLTEHDYLYPEHSMNALYDVFSDPREQDWQTETFTGATGEELNLFLQKNAGRKVVVQSEAVSLDASIVIPDKTWLCGEATALTGGGAFAAFELDGAANVVITGFAMDGGFDYGLYARNATGIVIAECDMRRLSRKPIVFIGNCKDISVLNNRVEDNAHGGLYFNGDIARVLVQDNHILSNRGTSNWMAGIVLTAIRVDPSGDAYAPFSGDLHFPKEERLDSMLQAPHDVVLRGNTVYNNNSSGVYCDGPYRVYIIDNRIVGNDKEGMCLDYGTVAVYVTQNDIASNGNRARQTDDDLRMDFVLDHGRLKDGSAAAKLPGISIDNSAYNIVFNNRISQNYGSGIKMVRTGIRNIISTNLIMGNNAGASDAFHFFGVEIGNAPGDVEAANLDFTPGYENMICRNMITGKHYAGIFIAEECYINDCFDNSIMDATNWSMECFSDKFNSSVNNYSLISSLGIPLSNTIAIGVGSWVR